MPPYSIERSLTDTERAGTCNVLHQQKQQDRPFFKKHGSDFELKRVAFIRCWANIVPRAIIPAPVAAIRVASQVAIIWFFGISGGGFFGWLVIIVLFDRLESNRGKVLIARPLAP